MPTAVEVLWNGTEILGQVCGADVHKV
jgi:hypothetical protein